LFRFHTEVSCHNPLINFPCSKKIPRRTLILKSLIGLANPIKDLRQFLMPTPPDGPTLSSSWLLRNAEPTSLFKEKSAANTMFKCLLGLPTLTVSYAGISCWGAVRVGIANPNSTPFGLLCSRIGYICSILLHTARDCSLFRVPDGPPSGIRRGSVGPQFGDQFWAPKLDPKLTHFGSSFGAQNGP
jgi:hypothetical protein